MEYALNKESCNIRLTELDAVSEVPVDIDLDLPDYCPDIERILKCRLRPCVISKSITGDRLSVDGNTIISLYYLDSKKKTIRCCEHSRPFSVSFRLSGDQKDSVASVRLRTEYLNCRAVGPRRLDIHGAFSVCARVFRGGALEYCSDIQGEDIQQQKHTERLSVLRGFGQQQFTVSEVFDLGQDREMPETILRSELSVIPGDCRAVDDKLMIRGDAVLKLLYVTDIESGSLETMTFDFPVSQVVDVMGISESTVNDISVDVMSYDVSLRSEYEERGGLISLEAKLSALAFAYEDGEAELIDDAYSTDYELETSSDCLTLTRMLSLPEQKTSVSAQLSMDGAGVSRISDVWCDSISFAFSSGSGELAVRGKLVFCVLGEDREGVPFCREKSADLEFGITPRDSSGSFGAEVSVIPQLISYVISSEDSVELKAVLRLRGCLCDTRKCRCIVSAEAPGDRPRIKDAEAALTLYYADEGESLWDIARMYCTSPEAIRLENDLSGEDNSGRTMLVIPM